ncbi:MAG: hypothetical protein ACREMJ_00240 [Gemmatimonadales bacterium]
MVRGTVALLALAALACRENRPMADRVELPHVDSAMLTDMPKLDSLLDTMPGGEMVRGNESAAMRLIKRKM